MTGPATMPRPPRRIELVRRLIALGTLACAAAAGLVELVALQRSRHQLRRGRQQHTAHH
ncbi:hypothetical protein [Acidovorax sp. NO-1]|uniref:hypothetical protein n=1 Tax=Acidovorax sp. NO-1 TaxID=512030 RepID=UPI001ED93D84|nr:hypothetical protein [Acidovorax sp. NO-1]